MLVSSDDEDENAVAEEQLRHLQATLGISFPKALVTASGCASAGGDTQEYEWETVPGDVTTGAAPGTGPTGVAGAEPGVSPDLPIGQQSAAQIRSFMSRLPPKDRHQYALKRCLEENMAMQGRHRQMLASLERATRKNDELIAAVTSLKQHRKLGSANRITGTAAAGKSRFWRAPGGATPALNADAVQLLGVFKYLPHTFDQRAWTADEDLKLREVVMAQVKNDVFSEQLDVLKERAACNPEDIAAATANIHQIPLAEVERRAAGFGGSQWTKVAAGVAGRSAEDCRSGWKRHLAAARGPWTAAEDVALHAIVKPEKNWLVVAVELGTGRLAAECLTRYRQQTALKARGLRWTDSEDAALKAAHEKYGKNWTAVAAELGTGRTRRQVLHRGTRRGVIQPIRKNWWDAAEDEALLLAVKEFGPKPKWVRVAERVPNRTDQQCRERYKNVLDPELNTGDWTTEEDVALLEVVASYTEKDAPVKWSAVANTLVGRTDSNVRRRHGALMKGLEPGALQLKAGRKRKDGSTGALRKLKRPAKRKRAALKCDESSEVEETESESGGLHSHSRESQMGRDVLAPTSTERPLRTGLRLRAGVMSSQLSP